MDKESFFISFFTDSHIGDDGAVLENEVISKDLFCEGIHFKREWMSLKQIAQKSMIVNISDAIAMNAKPKYALLGIKIPKEFSKKMIKELYVGFDEVCKAYNIAIIGGDTVAGEKLDISVTLISYTKNPIYRKGIKTGYLLAYTGELGNAKRGLDKLLRGSKIYRDSKFIKPKLRDKFFYQASRYISSALDISDGLYKDLSRLAKINKIGVVFFKHHPKNIACSGEEYEILFAFDKKYKNRIVSIARKTKTPITVFAKAKRGKFANRCKENHF